MARKRKMPFENKFLIKQELPTTYRVIGDGSDLKTVKNKVQAKNVSAPVPTPPKLPKPTTRQADNSGDGRMPDRGLPKTSNRDLSYRDLANIQGVTGVVSPTGSVVADLVTMYTAPAALRGSTSPGRSIQAVGGFLSRAMGAVSNTEQLARNEERRERASRTRTEAYQNRAAIAQATKAPSNNVVTGAQRGGSGGGVEANIRGPGGRGSESFGPSGRGSGGFDNGGFSRDRDFGGWT